MDKETIYIKKINNEYIIYTNKFYSDIFIIPIKELNIKDFNSKSLSILSKMAKNNKILVKINNNTYFDKIKLINELVKYFPNMLYVFATFKCTFNNDNVMLQIMQKYNISLNNFLHKLNLKKIKPILMQLLLSQLHAFDAVGFLHMDIHLGNILLKNKPVKLKYTINKKDYVYEFKYKIILIDYDKSIVMDKLFMNLPNYMSNYTLIYNIINTINSISRLLPLNEEIKLNENIKQIILDNAEKTLKSYYKYEIFYDEYKSKNINQCINFINKFWKLTYGMYLF